jgi:sugar/nucleoside kinase (ribokinase family)
MGDKLDIAIAGEINLDLILYGLPISIPVERELLAHDFQLTLGSSSAILAHNLAILGANVGFITRVGTDPLGTIAIDRLRESGAELSRIVQAESPAKTGVTILLHHSASRHILTYPGTMSEMTRADLDYEYLASARHFHLSSLFLHRALEKDLPQLFKDLKRDGLTISLDTNDDPEDLWAGVLDELLDYVDILLPNEQELLNIARRDTTKKALAALRSRVPVIALKRGKSGALVQTSSDVIHVPPITVTPVDTIGAGDSFNTGFLFAYLQGADWEECARAGNIAGALSTLKPGGTESFRDAKLRDSFLAEHKFPGRQPGRIQHGLHQIIMSTKQHER